MAEVNYLLWYCRRVLMQIQICLCCRLTSRSSSQIGPANCYYSGNMFGAAWFRRPSASIQQCSRQLLVVSEPSQNKWTSRPSGASRFCVVWMLFSSMVSPVQMVRNKWLQVKVSLMNNEIWHDQSKSELISVRNISMSFSEHTVAIHFRPVASCILSPDWSWFTFQYANIVSSALAVGSKIHHHAWAASTDQGIQYAI